MARDARRFEKLSEPFRHRSRRRLKRLRHLAGFAAPLYGRAEVERHLDGLRPAQDERGRHNDHVAAREAARRGDPGAHFTADWLERRLEKSRKRSRRVLRCAVEAPPFRKGKAQPRRGKGGRG